MVVVGGRVAVEETALVVADLARRRAARRILGTYQRGRRTQRALVVIDRMRSTSAIGTVGQQGRGDARRAATNSRRQHTSHDSVSWLIGDRH